MCRLALYGKIESFSKLARSLNQLEQSCGGDGNGYYHVPTATHERGVELTTAEIAYQSVNRHGLHMFHTRLCTAGGIVDYLTHPFDAGDWMLMHNGCWWDWPYFAFDGEESDTETAAALVAEYGPGILLNSEFAGTGVWIVAGEINGEGRALVINRGTHEFIFQRLADGSYFHASEVIRHVKVKHSAKARMDTVYCVEPDGIYYSVDGVEPVPMPEELPYDLVAELHGFKSATGKGMAGSGYGAAFDADERLQPERHWERFNRVAGYGDDWDDFTDDEAAPELRVVEEEEFFSTPTNFDALD